MIFPKCALMVAAATTLIGMAQPTLAERRSGEAPVAKTENGQELPFARGHSFETLDAYLAYLEQYNGPIDLPWWRQVKPGLYEEVAHVPGKTGQPERATRQELMQRFGFAGPVRQK